MKNETTVTKKLTPAQAYALQVRADRRAAALERQEGSIAGDNARVNAIYKEARIQQAVGNFKKTAPVRRVSSKKIRWSPAELNLLVDLYLKYVDAANGCDNRELIVADFIAQYPARGESAVVLGVMQVKGLDVYYQAKGLKDTSQALINKLHSVDPIRFPGGATQEAKFDAALDNLLAEIRG
jgi:hypothetical protein